MILRQSGDVNSPSGCMVEFLMPIFSMVGIVPESGLGAPASTLLADIFAGIKSILPDFSRVGQIYKKRSETQ
jgi:hypothetical protein